MLTPTAKMSRGGTARLSPTDMRAIDHRDDRSRCQIDAVARAEIEVRADRKLTDEEWSVARARLLEFTSILRGWDRKTTAPRRGNVEVLCQPEP